MPQFYKKTFPLIVSLAFGLGALTANAESLSASSASGSLGSSSASFGKSSDSSSSKTKVAQGDYKVIDMAQVPDQPGLMRLRLQAVAAGTPTEEFSLILPQKALERGEVTLGTVVQAQHREYGVAFAAVRPGNTANTFFLVLDDVWYRELDSRPVSL